MTPTIEMLDFMIEHGAAKAIDHPIWCDIQFRIVELPDGTRWKHVDGGWGGNRHEPAEEQPA